MASKGMSMELITVLVIILASTIVILFSYAKISEFVNSKSDTEICKTSVELRAKSKVLGIDLLKIPINCPESKPIQVKNKGDWKTETKKELAGAMYDCWYQFGEGKLDFLDEYDFGDYNQRCYICSSFVFDKELSKETIEKFDIYLTENGYTSYLYGETNKTVEQKDLQNQLSGMYGNIYTNKPLYVLFVADRDWDDWRQQLKQGVNAGIIGCGAGGLVGGKIGIIGGVGGIATGAAIGCIGGGIVSGITFGYLRQNLYVPYLYLTNSDEVALKCSNPSSKYWKERYASEGYDTEFLGGG